MARLTESDYDLICEDCEQYFVFSMTAGHYECECMQNERLDQEDKDAALLEDKADAKRKGE